MWEFRLTWPLEKPAWWDRAWGDGLRMLAERGRPLDDRSDDYLAVEDRPDAGLKLRGGPEKSFDVKVLHERKCAWELWEKVRYFRWNDLEASRFAALMQTPLPPAAPTKDVTAQEGCEKFLAAAGFGFSNIEVKKRRIQATVADLLTIIDGATADPSWLAEIVEITLPNRSKPLYSVGLESMKPVDGRAATARRCTGHRLPRTPEQKSERRGLR